jgi:hypothetical protein
MLGQAYRATMVKHISWRDKDYPVGIWLDTGAQQVKGASSNMHRIVCRYTAIPTYPIRFDDRVLIESKKDIFAEARSQELRAHAVDRPQQQAKLKSDVAMGR